MLTQRQNAILGYLQKAGQAPQSAILMFIVSRFDKVSKPTILRDLDVLLLSGLIKKSGKGRSVVYLPKIKNSLLYHFDPETYFKLSQDQREIKNKFDWKVFDQLNNLFTKLEIKRLDLANAEYQKNMANVDATTLR